MPDFFMVRLPLDARRLAELAAARRLPLGGDDGYLIHTCLAEALVGQAPQPFRVMGQANGRVDVLAYSGEPLAALHSRSKAFADPSAYARCLWDSAADKPMPSEWRAGTRLQFEVRVCPVVRRARGGGGRERAGAEVDAFLAHLDVTPTDKRLARAAVYVDWVAGAVARGGATLVRADLKGFGLRRLVRRDATRTAQLVPARARDDRGDEGRPDALVAGLLEVADGEAFGHLLRRGVGRHRAFGFGMLLLRPDHGAEC